MPAYADHESIARPRERAIALAAVVVVQAALAIALLIGLRVDVRRSADVVERLIAVTLVRPSPPRVEPAVASREAKLDGTPAPKTTLVDPGGSPGPKRAQALPSVAPIIAVKPTAAPSGGGTGLGVASGTGSGGGTGGRGNGAGGGRDLELLSGDIVPSDYPRRLARAGIGGTVYMRCTVLPTGRVARCRVTRSSGVPELDAITPRLIEQRFVYRPATDSSGRPVSDDIDVDWTWD